MKIPSKTVIHVSGGVELKADDCIHILHYDVVPYQRFCDKSQCDIDYRHVSVTAHASEYCPTCLRKYRAYRDKHNILDVGFILGLEKSNRIIVASGSQYSEYSVLNTIMPKAKIKEPMAHSLRLDLLRMFNSNLVRLAANYGYDIEWDGDYRNANSNNPYLCLGVLAVKTKDTIIASDTMRYERLFDWSGLLYLAIEHTANRHLEVLAGIERNNKYKAWIATK